MLLHAKESAQTRKQGSAIVVDKKSGMKRERERERDWAGQRAVERASVKWLVMIQVI
jgi:hypothetical protein